MKDDLKDETSRPAARPLRARRLLVATVGAASVTFSACADELSTYVANLMAPPFMPPAGGAGSGTGSCLSSALQAAADGGDPKQPVSGTSVCQPSRPDAGTHDANDDSGS
jgi:hypothetical protein